MKIWIVFIALVLLPFLNGCSDPHNQKPVNSYADVVEEEEVADRGEKPNLYDRNREEVRELEKNPGRYRYRYGYDSRDEEYPKDNQSYPDYSR